MPNSGSTHSNIKTIRFDLKNIGSNDPLVPKYNGYLFNSVAFLSSSPSIVEQREIININGDTKLINTHISNLFNIYINKQNNYNVASDGGLLLFGFYQEDSNQSKKGIMIAVAGLGLDSNNNAKSLIVSADIDIPISDIDIDEQNNYIIDRTKTYDILIKQFNKQFNNPEEDSTIIFKLYNKIVNNNNTNIVQWAINNLSE